MSKSWIHSAQVAGLVCCLAGCGGGGDGSPEADAPAAGGGPVAAASWQVGGTAQGVSGAGLMLLNNGSERLAVPANGSFAFATALASGATFSISIAAQPSGQLCSVTNGSGSVVDANVTAVGVSCVTAAAGAGAEHGSGPDPIAAISTNPGSGDLIRAALDAGTLTPEQALIYAMYAEYEDPRLPAQYLGDDAGLIEGTAHEKVLDHIATVGLANVSQATLDALKPFFIPAHHGRQLPARIGRRARQERRARDRAARESKAGWTAVGGTNVVVWYETSRAATDAAERRDAGGRDSTTRIWPMLTGLMGRTPKSDLGLEVVHRDRRPARRDARGHARATTKAVTTPVDWVAEDTAVQHRAEPRPEPAGPAGAGGARVHARDPVLDRRQGVQHAVLRHDQGSDGVVGQPLRLSAQRLGDASTRSTTSRARSSATPTTRRATTTRSRQHRLPLRRLRAAAVPADALRARASSRTSGTGR